MGNQMILLLRLEGPLQSWGERARWDYRDTAPMPTKSGVIGLLSCALGLTRTDPEIRRMDEQLRFGVRTERAGRIMTDYQTITGTIRTAEGKQRGKKDEDSTLQSWRQYLQDAAFLAALTGDEGMLQQCAEALKHPVWPVFLGRKSCVPTRPVYENLTMEYASLEDALTRYPVSEKGSTDAVLLCEIDDPVGGQYLRRDKILGTPVRTFGDRRIRIISVDHQEGISL